MIDFKQIEAFVWVAELGGFSAAAEKLNTTQPSISQRIASFERQVSTRVLTVVRAVLSSRKRSGVTFARPAHVRTAQ